MHTATSPLPPAATPVIDEQKLHELLGRAIVDFGGADIAPLVVIGDRLGLFRALAAAWPAHVRGPRRADRHRRALRARVAERAGRLGLRDLPRRIGPLLADAGAGAGVRRRGRPGVHRRRLPDRGRRRPDRRQAHRGLPHRRGRRLARARSRRLPRRRALLPLVVSRQPDRRRWIPALDGMEAKLRAGARVADIGCGHGASTIIMAQAYPAVALRRLRLARGVDRRRQRPRPQGRHRRPLPVRGRRRQGLSRHRLRPRHACSTPCTTWAIRPARRGTSCRRWRPAAAG